MFQHICERVYLRRGAQLTGFRHSQSDWHQDPLSSMEEYYSHLRNKIEAGLHDVASDNGTVSDGDVAQLLDP